MSNKSPQNAAQTEGIELTRFVFWGNLQCFELDCQGWEVGTLIHGRGISGYVVALELVRDLVVCTIAQSLEPDADVVQYFASYSSGWGRFGEPGENATKVAKLRSTMP